MIERKTALVTGAGRGIGKEIAKKLAQEGFNIALNYRSDESAAKIVKEELENLGVDVLLVQGDVSKMEDCERIFEEAVSQFGKIEVLVNNAGITRDKLILRMTEEDFDDVIDANLKSAFMMMKVLAKHMSKNRYGKIVNISSIVGITGNAGQINYAASKAGMIGMTKSLAKELGSRGVCVNAVAPGFIKSDMTDKLPEDIIKKYEEAIALKRLGSPEDVANLVAFLASDEANYITGQVISVDGGMNF
ncbi:MAG: 3-oxoacyl-[acyl-carrier-protein] reductase [Tissierellia bacterium]|nr:3-oxoacyl-[acyl-carrier-protein] reductase [Tissierellia bacterium]